MATPAEKLATSLRELKKLQDHNKGAIRAKDLTRTHKERLIKNGFLKEVIKGWYVPSRPDEQIGESTAWYASFWGFCAAYLNEKYGNDWCLSPEQSIALHAGNWTIPNQLLIHSPKAQNNVTKLPHNTSLLDIKVSKLNISQPLDALRVLPLSLALIRCSTDTFRRNSTDARIALSMIKDASDVLEYLLDGGHSSIAGRLAGAFRNINRDEIADDIIKAMNAADYKVSDNDPFLDSTKRELSSRESSPYVNRIKLMWTKMREDIIENFPVIEPAEIDSDSYLKLVEDNYVNDAYHSLSIEGYIVTPELVQKVQGGNWNPEHEPDKEHKNALAARGYWQAFQQVKNSIKQVLSGDNAGNIAKKEHSDWYRELFSPSVKIGLLKPSDLAGYRNMPVYIRFSKHVPLNAEAVRDAMPTLLGLLAEEDNLLVRVVLGHFIFVYIHPYMDGNGRIGRFLMNLMLASGNLNWLVIPVEKRNEYMNALEEASVNKNILPFTSFIVELLGNN